MTEKYYTRKNVFDLYLSNVETGISKSLWQSIFNVFNDPDTPIFGNESEDDEEDCVYFGEDKSLEAVQELATSAHLSDGIFDLMRIAHQEINKKYDHEQRTLSDEYQDKKRDDAWDRKYKQIEEDRKFYLDDRTRSSKNLANYFMSEAAFFFIYRAISEYGLNPNNLTVNSSTIDKIKKALKACEEPNREYYPSFVE